MSTAQTNNIYIESSGYPIEIGDDITVSNTTQPTLATYTYTNSYAQTINTTFNGAWNDILNPLIDYLSEVEISDVINKITSRMDKEDLVEIRAFISNIIRRRHFSEKFLMDFIDFITKTDIMVLHESDIRSGDYPQLALYFKTID